MKSRKSNWCKNINRNRCGCGTWKEFSHKEGHAHAPGTLFISSIFFFVTFRSLHLAASDCLKYRGVAYPREHLAQFIVYYWLTLWTRGKIFSIRKINVHSALSIDAMCKNWYAPAEPRIRYTLYCNYAQINELYRGILNGCNCVFEAGVS